MRIAILSDIHGNLPALEAVLEDAARQHPDLYLIAGDLAARAPFPLETLHMLQSLDAPAHIIAGNADLYQTEYAAGIGVEAYERGPGGGVIRWTHRALGEEGISFLNGLIEQKVIELPGLPAIRMVHGSPGRVNQGMIPDRDENARRIFWEAGLWPEVGEPVALADLLAEVQEDVVVCGHTHIPWSERVREKRILAVNPGAVGFPIHGDWRAQYAVLEWIASDQPETGWRLQHRAVAYDLQQLESAYRQSGLLEEGGFFARAMLANARTGQNVTWFFFRHALELNRPPEQKVGWEQAAAGFPWDIYER